MPVVASVLVEPALVDVPLLYHARVRSLTALLRCLAHPAESSLAHLASIIPAFLHTMHDRSPTPVLRQVFDKTLMLRWHLTCWLMRLYLSPGRVLSDAGLEVVDDFREHFFSNSRMGRRCAAR